MKDDSLQNKIADALCKAGQDVLNADTMQDLIEDSARRQELECNPEVLDLWNKLLEADSKAWGEFLEGRSCGENLEQFAEKYLALLKQLVYEITTRNLKEDCGRFVRQLELLMRWKGCMLSLENRLLIPRCHPMEMIAKALGEVLEQQGGSKLARVIMERNKKRYQGYTISLSDQVFLRTSAQGNARCFELLPIQEAGGLTEISSIRFIEKVGHFLDTHHKESFPAQVRIACVGEVQKPELIEEYYRECKDCEIRADVQLFRLDRVKTEEGRLLFRIAPGEKRLRAEDKRMFNLLLVSDLEILFHQFDMVFFMDEGCFYSAGQARKSLEERMVMPQLEWLHERAGNTENSAEKLILYREEYEMIGQWLNGMSTNTTARLQFSAKLFHAIHHAVTPECDVYLYISQGRKVGEVDLYHRNVCNDEDYGGRTISVYKVPGTAQKPETEAEDMRRLLENTETEVMIDVWKLLKSIDDQYRRTILEDMWEAESVQAIGMLKKAFLVFNYSMHIPEGKINCKMRLEPGAMSEAQTREVKTFLEMLFNECFYHGQDSCVNRYLRRLVSNAVIARAGNVKAILLGYLIKTGYLEQHICWNKEIEIVAAGVGNRKETFADELFKSRRTVYSVIRNLSRYQLRDIDRREEFLMNDFRKQYCTELDKAVFGNVIGKIHEACRELGYQDSGLYAYSDLREEKVRWVK